MVRRVESELPQWQQGNILNRGLKIYFIFTTVCTGTVYVHYTYKVYFHARYKLHVHVPQVENKVRVYTYITRRYIHLRCTCVHYTNNTKMS